MVSSISAYFSVASNIIILLALHDNEYTIFPSFFDAGIWHSIAVILVAPLFGDSGWVCSFGTGTKGQLGLGSGGKDKFGNPTGPVMFSSKPLIIEEFRQDITVRSVAVGCNHNIALTNTNEMYSWGSNKCGALGRPKSLGKLLLLKVTFFL